MMSSLNDLLEAEIYIYLYSCDGGAYQNYFGIHRDREIECSLKKFFLAAEIKCRYKK